MKKVVKIVVALVLIMVLVVVALVFRLFLTGGKFKTINPHYESTCTRVSNVPGPEDITIHPKTGVLLISSDDRRFNHDSKRVGPPRQGNIYSLDLKEKGAQPKNLTTGFSKPFHPHGLSLYLDPSGKEYLFVVNHPDPGKYDTVEIFEYVNGGLKHLETIDSRTYPLMFSPNDVLAVGPRSFYVTNDHGNTSPRGRKAEDYLQLKRSFVNYFDGKEMRVVAGNIGFANGINISPDGKSIYVASPTGLSVKVYSRDVASGDLTPAYDIDLGTGVDNIEVDASGNLYIGCHAKLLDFLAYAKSKANLSPSQVMRVTILGKGKDKVEEIYLNDGKELSGSSVAAPFTGGFAVGQVYDDHFLICTNEGAPVK
jgi:arylesterase/paraoxonase